MQELRQVKKHEVTALVLIIAMAVIAISLPLVIIKMSGGLIKNIDAVMTFWLIATICIAGLSVIIYFSTTEPNGKPITEIDPGYYKLVFLRVVEIDRIYKDGNTRYAKKLFLTIQDQIYDSEERLFLFDSEKFEEPDKLVSECNILVPGDGKNNKIRIVS